MTVTQQIAAVPAGAESRPPERTDFEIVPVRGLAIVALVLAGLVTVIATNSAWGIDF